MSERDILPLVRRAKERGVRGAFLLPSRHSDEEMRLDERFLACCDMEHFPVVLLERNLRGHNRPLDRDLVAVDDLDGAARCTRHLIDLGRKRVAIVVASPTSSHNDRVAGYLYALHAAQSASRKSVERKPIVLYQSHDLPSRDAYAKLADQVRKLEVDGVVCYQDYTAMGVIVELLARGLSVPDDVAVVGFDDLPIGNLFTVGVTTYAYPSEGMAEQAVRLMRERLRDPKRAPTKVVVPGRLIVRESSVGAHGREVVPRSYHVPMPEFNWTLVALCAAAFFAGVMNSVAGGGTLLTFPALTGVVSRGDGERHQHRRAAARVDRRRGRLPQGTVGMPAVRGADARAEPRRRLPRRVARRPRSGGVRRSSCRGSSSPPQCCSSCRRRSPRG